MKVSVVTPNYNGLKFLNTYFETLAIQGRFIEEIIIVDNGSTDGSIQLIEEYMNSPNFKIDIKLIKNEENLGFAPAVNQGIRMAKSEYIFSINNDVELDFMTIEKLLESMEGSIASGDNPFSIQSKMISYHDKDLIDDAGDEYNLLAYTKKLGDGSHKDNYNEKMEIFSSCAGAALYRKSALEEIGCFDNNFFAYVEDGSATSGSRYNEFKIKLAARNNVWLIYKNYPIPQKIVNFIFIFLGFFIKYLFFLKKGYGSVYLSGVKEGLSQRKRIEKTKFLWKNWKNYFKIEWKMIKNTFSYFRK